MALLIENGPDNLMWVLRLDNKLYGNSINPTSHTRKVSSNALEVFIADIRETLDRLELIENGS